MDTKLAEGRFGFIKAVTKHSGCMLLDYVQRMSHPLFHCVEEEAHAGGRVQWSHLGLGALSTEFIYYPMGEDFMGFGLQAQPYTPAGNYRLLPACAIWST